MSRCLHILVSIFLESVQDQFDAIGSSEWNPMFYLEYVAQDPIPIQGIVDEHVQETTVKVVFKDEEAMTI